MANSAQRFKKINSKTDELNSVQQNVQDAINPIINSPIWDGVLVRDACLEPNIANLIKHKLSRKPIGWIITRKREDVRIWDIQDANTSPSKTLALATSHSCKVDIWIF